MSLVGPPAKSCAPTSGVKLDDRWDAAQWLCWTASPGTPWKEARTQGFWKLFQSIRRHGQPMTSPVLMRVEDRDGSSTLTTMFKVTVDATPEDAADGIFSETLPAAPVRSYTFRKFGGYGGEDECRRALRRLAECAGGGSPAEWFVAFYDPPYRLRKEVEVFFFSSPRRGI